MSVFTHYLKADFTGHDVSTIEAAGFKGLKNGALLRAANADFDVLITVDKNIPYQQNLTSLSIGILILVAKSNKYADLKPLVPQALEALKSIQPGAVVRVL